MNKLGIVYGGLDYLGKLGYNQMRTFKFLRVARPSVTQFPR